MKKFYLSILFVFAIVALTNAQTFDFTNSTDNFTPTGASAVTLNPTSITYTVTSARTNFYIDQATVANGGTAINTANYNYAKVVLKNNSNLGLLTIRSGNTILGAGSAIAISKGDTEFKTYYYQLNSAAWTGTIEGVRVFFGTGTTTATDNIEIDKVEFISFTSTPTTNGFIKNPGFEDVLGSSTPWKTSSNTYVKSLLDNTNVRTGQASMKIEYLSTTDAATNLFIFSDDTMGVAPGTAGTVYSAGTVIEVKCWIKTSAGTPAFNMLMRFPLRDGVSTTSLKNVDAVGAIPAGDGTTWHQVTFSYTTTSADPDFKTIGIWPGIISTEGLGGLNTTHAVYLDDFTSTFTGATTLGLNDITKNDASISLYPNPVKDVLNITTDKNVQKVEVVDILGKTVLSSKADSKNMNVSSLNAGVYLIVITSENGVSTKKFIKE